LDPGIFYRFMFISPPKATAQLEPVFRQTAMSFRRLTAQEAATIQPLRIRAVAVGNGDTIETLARRMAFDRLQRERFTVLNGLFDGAALRPGEHVKIVVEGGRG
jgi:predicted Zn-dependent protease